MTKLTDEQEKMLKRVQGLLAKAEDEGATEEEADALTAKAAELMAKYSIDAALLSAKADVREIPCDKKIKFEGSYCRQHVFLYYAILRAFGGEGLLTVSPTRGRNHNIDYYVLHVYGFEANLFAVDVLYTSLYQQGVTRSKRVPYYEHAKTWRVSFWTGFTSVVSKRLEDANATVKDAGEPGTALVLRDRTAVVKAKMGADHPRMRSSRAQTSVNSANGYNAGEAAGHKANLHNQSNVGQQRRTALA